ncbi:MAG: stage II sporulation protein M [Desulfurococcaceae archaeon]
MSSQRGDQGSDQLFEVIKTFIFNKESPVLYVLPSLFLVPAVILFLSFLDEALTGYITQGDVLIPGTIIQWAFTMFLAYMISSSVASYKILRLIRKHLYESSVTTYYFTRNKDFMSLLQYLKNAMSSTEMPSPVTGVVLSIVTGGISYPIISCVIEKVLREHMNMEERALLKQEFTKRYGGLRSLLQLILMVLTLGVYLMHQTWKTISLYNKHVETIHKDHPNPPSSVSINIEGEGPPYASQAFFHGVILLAMALFILLSCFGLFTTSLVAIGIGALWSVFILLNSHRSVKNLVIINIATAYLLIISGLFMGIAGFNTYSFYFYYLESLEAITKQTPLFISIYIFINNAVVSLPAIIPYVGLIPLTTGILNAGLIIGLEAMRRCVNIACVLGLMTILIYPHTVLELLAYAVIASSISKWGKWREFSKLLIIGLIVLLIAALVETATLMALRQ